MTDHRREAERLADQANHYTYGDGADSAAGQALATEGLVHAVLALAASHAPRLGVDYDQHNELVVEHAMLRRIVAAHLTAAIELGDQATAGAAATALSDDLAIHEFDLSDEYAAHEFQSYLEARDAEDGEDDHGSGEAGKDTPKGESTQPPAEQFVPRTERSYWQTIADALNASAGVGMHVGIDIDGTLTDHQAWSVVWDRQAKEWAVAGYNDDHGSIEDVYSASELHEMDQDAEFALDAADDVLNAERGEDE